jgi:hypothetical protein
MQYINLKLNLADQSYSEMKKMNLSKVQLQQLIKPMEVKSCIQVLKKKLQTCFTLLLKTIRLAMEIKELPPGYLFGT